MSLPLVKAKYHARAVGAPTFKPSSNGNMQMAVPVEVVEGDLAGEGITWIPTFTDNTAERIVESLMHMGWEGDDPTELQGLSDAEIAQRLPNVVEIVCEPDTYNGVTKLKVAWVNRIGGNRFSFTEQAAPNELKSFGASLRSTVKGLRAQGGMAPRKPAANGSRPNGQSSLPNGQHPNAPGADEDIPF